MSDKRLISMPVEELWELHQQVSELLATKLNEQKEELERCLDALSAMTERHPKRRRAYPPVPPKFANPDAPNEVWSGRGRKPRWPAEKLSAGFALQDLSIRKTRANGMQRVAVVDTQNQPKPVTRGMRSTK